VAPHVFSIQLLAAHAMDGALATAPKVAGEQLAIVEVLETATASIGQLVVGPLAQPIALQPIPTHVQQTAELPPPAPPQINLPEHASIPLRIMQQKTVNLKEKICQH